jgi:hypothetical protein
VDRVGDGTWKVRGGWRVCEGEGGERRRVECGRSKGGGRETTQVGLEMWSGNGRVMDCVERWIREEFLKCGQRVHPRGVSNM